MAKKSKKPLPLKGASKTIAVATIVFLLFAIITTVIMSQKQQNTQQEAANSRCTNIGGRCKDIIRDKCSGRYVSGLCNGPSRVRCCVANSDGWRKTTTTKRTCSSEKGRCLDLNKYNCTVSISGLCPGASNIKCCTGNYYKK